MVADSYLRDMKTGTETKLTKNVDFAPEVTQAIRKRLLVERPRDNYKFYIDVTLPEGLPRGHAPPGHHLVLPDGVLDAGRSTISVAARRTSTSSRTSRRAARRSGSRRGTS